MSLRLEALKGNDKTGARALVAESDKHVKLNMCHSFELKNSMKQPMAQHQEWKKTRTVRADERTLTLYQNTCVSTSGGLVFKARTAQFSFISSSFVPFLSLLAFLFSMLFSSVYRSFMLDIHSFVLCKYNYTPISHSVFHIPSLSYARLHLFSHFIHPSEARSHHGTRKSCSQ